MTRQQLEKICMKRAQAHLDKITELKKRLEKRRGDSEAAFSELRQMQLAQEAYHDTTKVLGMVYTVWPVAREANE